MRTRCLIIAALLAALAACGEVEYGSVEDALAALESGGRHARIQAARHLAEKGPKHDDGTVARALARAIDDDEPWVRRWAAAALGNDKLDATIAIPALITLIDDEILAIRVAAACAIGYHGADAAPAVERLVRIVAEEDGLIREMASWALGEIGKPARTAAMPVLERMTGKARERLLLSLPVVAGVAEQQYDHDEELVNVCVDCRPAVCIRGYRHDLPILATRLARWADTGRQIVEPHLSSIFVQLAVDEDLPWAAAQAILEILVRPEVRIANVEIAMRRAEEIDSRGNWTPTGKMRVHLPFERGPEPDVVITLPGSSDDGLGARLTALYERDPTTRVSLRPHPSVPVQRVLEVAAMMHRVGIWIHLDGLALGPVLPDSFEPAGEVPRAAFGDTSDFAEDAPLLRRIVEDARREVGGADGYEWTEVVR